MAARASNFASINACVITLSRPCQQLLDALSLLPQPTTVPALVRLLDTELDAADLDAALGRLADLALVFRTGEELRLHPQIQLLSNPAGLGPPADTLLAGQTASTLEAMARRLELKIGRNKHETLARLVVALSDPELVKQALQGSPAGTLDLANQLSEHPIGSVPSGTYYLRGNTPLGWMAERGLVVTRDWETVVMPREVGLSLRGGRPFPDFDLRPPTIRWRPTDAGSVDRCGTEQALRVVADLATILDSWNDSPPKLLKAGGVGIRDIRRAATAVGCSEGEAARLIELAAVAGLAGWNTATDTALPGAAYDDWLDLDLADRWVAVATAWLAAELHVNLAGATGSNQKPIPPLLNRWPETPARRRRWLVLAALLGGESGQAADANSLATRVVWDAPSIWTGGPARPPLLVSWVREEAEMLGVCSSGALSSLGRAVATGQLEQAETELAVHAPPVTSQFVLQADLTAVATGPLTAHTRCDLDLMADLESSGAATVYRFSEQSLRRAYDAGRTATELVGFLEAHASKGVPQPLAYLVEDIGRRHGQVRIGTATCYLRSDDPSLLAEMLVARRSAKLGLRQLAPTVLMSSASAETVIATLRTGGYLPAEEDGSGALIVHRREAGRATTGHGPSRTGQVDALAAELVPNEFRPRPESLTAFDQAVAGTHSPDQRRPPDPEELVRRLRPTRMGRASALDGTHPSSARAQPVNANGANGSSPIPPPFSQLDLLPDDDGRPRHIAKSRLAILELLELSLEEEWMLRLEYTSQRGRNQQLNAAVFNIGGKQVTVGTLPGFATRTLTISGICWARALTQAEEDAL